MAEPEDRLLRLLDGVNEWLRFAETKNGGITAISGLATTAAFGYLNALKDPSWLECWGLGISCCLFLLSVVLAVVSFIPQTDPEKFRVKKGNRDPSKLNPYFFGDLALMTGDQLADQFSKLEGVTDRPAQLAEQQLADQVVINSRITQHKLFLFALSAQVFLAGVVLSGASILISRTLL